MKSDRVVLLAGRGESTSIVYHAISKHLSIERVILEQRSPRSLLIKRRAKRHGLIRTASQTAFSAVINPLLRRASRGRAAELRSELGSTLPPAEAVTEIATVNSQECIELLRELNPAVVVVNGTRIIKQEVLEATDAVFINMHAGITPRYRGVHGAYWAIAEGFPEDAGVTVHLVDKGIDTGKVLRQARIKPTEKDNFATYPLLQLRAGLPLLIDAVKDALEGRVEPREPMIERPSALWYHPTVGEYLRGRLRGAK